VAFVHPGDVAEIRVAAFPDLAFSGTVAFLSYQLDPETRTLDVRIEVANADLKLRPGMFADAVLRLPVADAPTTVPSTGPSTAPARSPIDDARAFQAALQPYLAAQKLLASDKAEGVDALLGESLDKAAPLMKRDQMGNVAEVSGLQKRGELKELPLLRTAFKDLSNLLIPLGKSIGLPEGSASIDIQHCPMYADKPNWLQESGQTANPYYGKEMLTCGAPVGTLPKVPPTSTPLPRPARPAAKVMAIPRSAVINTGRNMVVYVESAAGVYDMRDVKLGALADDYYPVLAGLKESDRVVTTGAFLLDAENRLNPAVGSAFRSIPNSENATPPPGPLHNGHQH
jgi:hypothetical protein